MTTLRNTVLASVFALWGMGAAAQTPAENSARIFRTEVTPYANREDAVARRTSAEHVLKFEPATTNAPVGGEIVHRVEIPLKWHSGDIYLHLENIPSAYILEVNGHRVARIEDMAAAADFRITRYITDAENEFRLRFVDAGAKALSQNLPEGKPFAGSRLYAQDHRAIVDYEAEIVPDPEGRNFGILHINAVVRNAYTTNEPLRVHFDLYDPAGKLVDHNNLTQVIPAGATDTIRFSTHVYGAYKYKWTARKTNPGLYKAMLFINRQGTYKEYMPFNLGFGKTEWVDGKLTRFGEELVLKKTVLNATDQKTTILKLKSLRKQGFNTITPDYPQPEWFYAACDELGLYVIDQADIRLDEKREDRSVGGTPSNDPKLVEEFAERVKAMYYRSRNHVSVIAYSLGAPSGNGYNMYKAYEWLKSVEKSRPVIYSDADGEWNSDL